MKPLKHHETHYTKKFQKFIHDRGESGIYLPGNVVVVHVDRIEGLSTTDGVSDLVGWSDHGQYVAIEVKKYDEQPSKLQKRFLDSVPCAFLAGVQKSDDNQVSVTVKAWNDLDQFEHKTFWIGRER